METEKSGQLQLNSPKTQQHIGHESIEVRVPGSIRSLRNLFVNIVEAHGLFYHVKVIFAFIHLWVDGKDKKVRMFTSSFELSHKTTQEFPAVFCWYIFFPIGAEYLFVWRVATFNSARCTRGLCFLVVHFGGYP